jgi:hypothetical protein
MNIEIGRIWQEANLAKFEEVSWHIIGGTEENYEEPQNSLLFSLYSNLESREYKPLIPWANLVDLLSCHYTALRFSNPYEKLRFLSGLRDNINLIQFWFCNYLYHYLRPHVQTSSGIHLSSCPLCQREVDYLSQSITIIRVRGAIPPFP